MNINFRKANKNDIEFIIDCFIKIKEDAGFKKIEPISKSRIINDLLLDNPKAVCLIVENEGDSIGVVLYSTLYYVDTGQIMNVNQFYLKECYRGKGLFNNILKELNSISKQNGYSYIGWEVWPKYIKAKELYSHVVDNSGVDYTHFYKKVK
tara:strand:+ start:143 stop:595 length:453 start_codon:yes stop_codon:yes gene_type:complete